MAGNKKMGRSLVVASVVLSTVTNSIGAEVSNEKLANQLMTNLKKKVDTSLMGATNKPLLPAEDSRLIFQCLSDEMEFQNIHNSIFLSAQKNLETKNKFGIENLLAKNFTSNDFQNLKLASSRDMDGIAFKELVGDENLLDTNSSIQSMNSFANAFKKIDFAEFVTEKYISAPDKRGAKQAMNQATLQVSFDLRGIGTNSKKLQERGRLQIGVEKQKNKWMVTSLKLVSKEVLTTEVDYFKNITNTSQVAVAVPKYLRREAIRRGGYAMAIGDINNDSKKDLFVATVGETVTLNGKNAYEFERVRNPELDKQTLVKAAAFSDFKNNGNEDLLLVRFAPNESQTSKDRSDIQIYENAAGNLKRKQNVIGFNKETAYAMPLAIADFNNDGFNDFYIGFPGAKDFTTLSPAKHAANLTTQGVFFNQGNATFKDDAYRNFAKAHGNVDDLSKIFPHSAISVDFNQDGKMDLVVIDDRGNLSPLYINKGDGNFEYSTDKIGVGLKDYGMGADVADFNGDGKLDFVMSSVNFNVSKRLKESCRINWSVESGVTAGVQGLRIFNSQNGKYQEDTQVAGLDFVGEGSGGVKVLDYNNDGLPDLYLTSGLWTGSEKNNSQDLSTYFVAASMLGILEDDLKSELKTNYFKYEKVSMNNDFKALLFNSDSQSSIMDLLSFYRGDINGSKAKKALSLAGHQPNRMFRNNGNGTFTEVGYMLGVDSFADGYMAATADLDNDGNLDLVLRNADPGYNLNQFAPVEIYRNLGAAKKLAVTIKLKGTISNRDAIGTEVSAKVGNRTIVQQLVGNSGTVQSERIIHIGLDNNKQIESLKVKWPSGKVQNLQGLKPGFHIVEEPGLQVSKK